MARKVIKTMSDKMSEDGRSEGIDILDDSGLSSDPIVSALQTLRVTIDDIQYNNENHGTDKVISSIQANTAKTGITTSQASAISANTSKTGITTSQASAITANTNKVGFTTEMPTATEGHTVQLSVTNSRGAYALVFTMIDASGRDKVTKTVTVALR
jgi:hypothetical protein